MTSEIDKLLAVLDMTEEEQCRWLAEYFKAEYYKTDEWPQYYGYCDIFINNTFPSRKVILADLAFKMRNEAVKKDITKYMDAENIVKSYVLLKTRTKFIWSYDSQPIHWIIAALIAQEQLK